MPDAAGGQGEAHDATVKVENNTATDDAAEKAKARAIATADAALASAETAVQRQTEHLAAAKEHLAAAKAARKELD